MNYELDSTMYNGKHILSQKQWEKNTIVISNNKHNIDNIDNIFTYFRCFCCKIKIICE